MSGGFGRNKPKFPWLAAYWNSATASGLWRLAVATLGPVVALAIVLALLLGGGGSGDRFRGLQDDSVTGASPTDPGDAPAISPTLEIAPTAASPAATGTPEPRLYTVQPGDSITSICFEQVSELPPDECVASTVELNGLADAGQIAVDQVLVLPTGTSAAPPTPTLTPTPDPGTALVVRVIDGDTIELENDDVVRYIGIDTPETGSSADCFAPEAAARNRQLVEGVVVTLEKDVSEIDQFGRLLRYVYVDDVMINEILVREGYAKVLTIPPDLRHQQTFFAAEQLARLTGVGLWSACTALAPAEISVVPAGAAADYRPRLLDSAKPPG